MRIANIVLDSDMKNRVFEKGCLWARITEVTISAIGNKALRSISSYKEDYKEGRFSFQIRVLSNLQDKSRAVAVERGALKSIFAV